MAELQAPATRFGVMAVDLDMSAVMFGPRYYCPRCGPTNRIVSAHGRIICIVCEYDLACTTIADEIG